jgi:hypothetical protein
MWWMGHDMGAEEHGMGAGCGAPTLEKVAAAGEGELRASDAVEALATVACVGEERKYRYLF